MSNILSEYLTICWVYEFTKDKPKPHSVQSFGGNYLVSVLLHIKNKISQFSKFSIFRNKFWTWKKCKYMEKMKKFEKDHKEMENAFIPQYKFLRLPEETRKLRGIHFIQDI
jgi:hypothetical protein